MRITVKRFQIIWLSLLLLLLLAVSVFSLTDFFRGQEVFVQAGTENLRDAPGGKKIGRLDKGTPMIVLQDSSNWVRVRVEGWIWKESVTDNRYAIQGDYHAYQIVVKELSKAQEILQRLQKGERFTELAKKYSIGPAARKGGDLGYFNKGDFLPEFEQVILNLKPGQYSDVVKGKLGYHIFMRAN